MKKLLSLKKTAVIAATLFSVGAAQAEYVTAADKVLDFSWAYDTGSSTLTGFGSMTFSGFGTSTLTALTSLTNTSLLTSERLTAFGFAIDPNASGVTFTDSSDGGMEKGSLVKQLTGNLKEIEICAFSGPNCNGGGGGGISGANGFDAFTLKLSSLPGTMWGNSFEILPIGFKYQTGYGSFEFLTSSSSGSSGSVPEPNSAPLVLLGLGLLGASFAMRRRNSDQA